MASLPQAPCPTANLTTIVSAASHPFITYCGIDFIYSDLPDRHAATYKECIDACDTYVPNVTVVNGAACIAISWGNPIYSETNCYLKYQVIDIKGDMNIYSARRTGYMVGEPPVLGSSFASVQDTISWTPGASTMNAGETRTAIILTSERTTVSEPDKPTTCTDPNVSLTTTTTSLSFLAFTSTFLETVSKISLGLSITSSSVIPSLLQSSGSSTAILHTSSSGLSTRNSIGLYIGIAIPALLIFVVLILFVRAKNRLRIRRPLSTTPELVELDTSEPDITPRYTKDNEDLELHLALDNESNTETS